jgi:hypothetical protein
MDGLIIVYDPDQQGKEPELEKWFQAGAKHFSTSGLDVSTFCGTCWVISVGFNGKSGSEKWTSGGPWFQVFSQQGDVQLSANQCLVLGLHRSAGANGQPRAAIQGKLKKLPNAVVEVGTGG